MKADLNGGIIFAAKVIKVYCSAAEEEQDR
jgi:hypothetical protein